MNKFSSGEYLNQRSAAWFDIKNGILSWDLWLFLAWHDIKQRYKTSKLGPFWITMSTSIMFGGMVAIYANLFKVDMSSYAPFLASGLIFWIFTQTIITEACGAFIEQSSVLRQVRIPMSIYVLRVIARNTFVLFHNLLIVIFVNIYTNKMTLVGIASFVFSLGLVVILFFPVCLIIAIICARYRDIPMIIVSALQLIFYVTPVVWMPTSLSNNFHWIIEINPIYHVLRLLRDTITSNEFPLNSLWYVLSVFGFVSSCAFILHIKYRKRIAYWV